MHEPLADELASSAVEELADLDELDDADGVSPHAPPMTDRPTDPEAVTTGFGFWGAYHGGTGGYYFETQCAPGSVAIGLTGRAGSEIDKIGLICVPIDAWGVMGAEYKPGVVGGTGGAEFNLTCPGGYALAAIYGRSATRVDRLGLTCRPLTFDYVYNDGYAGGDGGHPFSDPSFQNWYVTHLRGRAANSVDAIQAGYSLLSL